MVKVRTVIGLNETREPIEVMEKAVLAISEGIKKLRSTRLNDKALFLLIQHAAPTTFQGKQISMSDVRAVIEGIQSLEATFLKKKG